MGELLQALINIRVGRPNLEWSIRPDGQTCVIVHVRVTREPGQSAEVSRRISVEKLQQGRPGYATLEVSHIMNSLYKAEVLDG